MRATHTAQATNRSLPCRIVGLAAVLAVTALVFFALPGAAAPVAGGGWEIGYQTFSIAKINELLKANYPTLRQSMLIFGGSGNGPLPIGDGNWTIGGFGAGGLTEERSGGKLSRLSLGYGGVRVGYTRSLTERVSFDAGFGVALGGVTLTAVEGDPASVSDGLKEPGEVTFNRFLLALMPEAGVSFSFTPMAHLQVSAGYFFDTGLGQWYSISGRPLGSEPSDRFSGLRVTLSLFFGPGRNAVGSEMAY